MVRGRRWSLFIIIICLVWMVLDRRHRHNHFLLLVRVCRSFSHFVLRQLQMTSVSYSTPANFNSRLELNATKKNDPLFNDADTCGGAQSSLNQSKTTTERKKKRVENSRSSWKLPDTSGHKWKERDGPLVSFSSGGCCCCCCYYPSRIPSSVREKQHEK